MANGGSAARCCIPGNLDLQALSKSRDTSPRDTVVLTVTNQTGDPVFNDPVHISLLTGLEQTPYLNVLAANKVGTALGKLRVSMDPNHDDAADRTPSLP